MYAALQRDPEMHHHYGRQTIRTGRMFPIFLLDHLDNLIRDADMEAVDLHSQMRAAIFDPRGQLMLDTPAETLARREERAKSLP